MYIQGKTLEGVKAYAYGPNATAQVLKEIMAEMDEYAGAHEVPAGFHRLMAQLNLRMQRLEDREFHFESEAEHEQHMDVPRDEHGYDEYGLEPPEEY